MKWQLFLIAIAFTGNAVYSDQHRSERDFSIDLQEAKEQEQTAFSKMDRDGDGRVSLSEFSATAANRHEQEYRPGRHEQEYRPGDERRMRPGPKNKRMRSGVHGPRMKPRHRGSDMAPRGRPNPGNQQEYRPGDERNREMRERRLFGLADIDKSGELSIDEFLGRGKAVRASMRSRGVKARFDAMDKNKDGQVDREEFPSRFPMLEKMDTDGDGQITREEMSKGRRDEGPR
tara:strand:+ start:154 stop:846 length:693 start_codon:yes stop_codon:yes gene_type:complete